MAASSLRGGVGRKQGPGVRQVGRGGRGIASNRHTSYDRKEIYDFISDLRKSFPNPDGNSALCWHMRFDKGRGDLAITT